MTISVIGTGYVGLVTAACFADLGHTVWGVDIDEAKVARLKNGECPIYEPGLQEILQRDLQNKTLHFTTKLSDALPHAEIVFCAVATPEGEDHKADLRAVFAVAEQVATLAEKRVIFVLKSTVPVGTGAECEKRIDAILKDRGMNFVIPVISNPEFLREGMAVSDTLTPERIVVGVNGDVEAKEKMEELYRPIARLNKPIVFMERESAEIVKYASNAFLAAKISFINMLTELCEKTGGNIRDVANAMGLDSRIGPKFLHAGIGYGGSCFPKDVKALMAIGTQHNVPMPLVAATDVINDRARTRFIDMLLKTLPKKASVGVWGLSFKPKTDDMREAPSIDVIRALADAGHSVTAFDPVAIEKAKPHLPASVTFADSPLGAAKGKDAVILLTEWDNFRGIDLKELKGAMKGTLLFDGRNIYEPSEVREAGLQYHGIGISSHA